VTGTARVGRVPTPRLAAVFAAAAAAALLAGALLPPAAARGAGVLAVTGACALALADALLCPRAAELRFGRAGPGPLRLLRPAAVTVSFLWSPTGRVRPRTLWWTDGPPASMVVRAPEGRARLAPGQTFTAAYHLLPRARGVVHWTGPRLTLDGPFGLWRTRLDGGAPLERTVYPGPTAGARLRGEAAAEGAPSRGDAGIEFDGIRPYAAGEDARRMHWRATARRDQPVVRRLRPERGRRLLLVLDAGRWSAQALGGPPGSPTRLDVFCEAALRVAATALAAGDAVGAVLLSSAGTPVVLAPRAGQDGLHRLAALLAGAAPSAGDPDLGVAVAAVLRLPTDDILWFGEAAGPGEAGDLLRHLPRLARWRSVAFVEARPAPPEAGADPGRATLLRQASEEALRRRRTALLALVHRGVPARDGPPGHLAAEAVGAYLHMARGGMAE